MTSSMLIVTAILVVAVILFVTEWLRVDVVALGVVVMLMLTGVLNTSEALAGFSNSIVLTIAALFIVGGGVTQTGLADQIGQRILALAGNSEARLILVLMAAVALLSGFLSNTGTVAVLLPAIVLLARRANTSPSRLLIPLAFASSLGGALTLIGTPPNLVVSDLLRENGFRPFGFFTFAPLGLALLAVGIVYMLTIGRKWLPRHIPQPRQAAPLEEHRRVVDEYHLQENLYRLRVRRDSTLIGKTVAESNLRRSFEVTILKIMRPRTPLPPAKENGAAPAQPVTMDVNEDDLARLIREIGLMEAESVEESAELARQQNAFAVTIDATTTIQANDVLIVRGDFHAIQHAAIAWHLGIQPAVPMDSKALIGREVGVAEVVIRGRSNLIGQSVTQARIGDLYHISVLGINRPGTGYIERESDVPLRFGDVLVIQGTWENILRLKQQRPDLIVMGQPEAMVEPVADGKSRIALAILLGMIGLMVVDWLPLATIAMLASLVMVLTGCLTMDDAYRAIDWKSLVLIAGMLPMSTALDKVGLVGVVAGGFVNTFGSMGTLAVIAGLFLMTAIFTQLLSNTATTVIIAPIALVAATRLGVQPHAFVMAVAIAASMAFASPVASPVNTLVMGAGNYRFSDFARVGIPLILLTMLVTLLLLPLLFPL
jgi:di/tricarboxylate transporter